MRDRCDYTEYVPLRLVFSFSLLITIVSIIITKDIMITVVVITILIVAISVVIHAVFTAMVVFH